MFIQDSYHIRWHGPGKNSSESMPVGGHDIGCNVWMQNNSVYLYVQQSGWFDENNSMLKFGRIRLEFAEDLIDEKCTQELVTEDGYVRIAIRDMRIEIWADVFHPVVHVDCRSDSPHPFRVHYESWRAQDRIVDRNSFELFQCKEVYECPDRDAVFHRDTILPEDGMLTAYHANLTEDLSFYKQFAAQGIAQLADTAYNPQKNLVSGGRLLLPGMKYKGIMTGIYQDTGYTGYVYEPETPGCEFHLEAVLGWKQTAGIAAWSSMLEDVLRETDGKREQDREASRRWWNRYFEKSYIRIRPGTEPDREDALWKIGRNYQLFRYMMGCNYFGYWPTKFNGGLFTFDPGIIEITEWWNGVLHFTPDYRLWGGGAHTIQNQRLLYWPMLRSGDAEVMPQQFNLLNRALKTAEMRTQFYFHIDGAFYPEQMGTYGLCNMRDHVWGNKTALPVIFGDQIKYLFSNNLEICLLILEYNAYTGADISAYMEMIDRIVMFYDGFYPENDENGRMIMYPANALETYHVVKNPIDGIAGLRCLLTRMLALPEQYASGEQKKKWQRILDRVPPVKTKIFNDREILAYADTESDIHNCELPEMYTVFPYDLYGTGKPDIELARTTLRNSFHTEEMKSHVSWHYTGIEYARLGMLPEALAFLKKKLADGPHRFPAFWGPGHDWTPDHNWGGSGSMQLQEMLMQTRGDGIFLFPCWPADCDVDFRLYAPHNTTVTCSLQGGEIVSLEVKPESRRKDIRLAGTEIRSGLPRL